MIISRSVKENTDFMKKKLNCDKNFDIVYRTIRINGRTSALFFVDGFANDEILEKLMEYFFSLENNEDFENADVFSENCLPYFEISLDNDYSGITEQILAGAAVLFIDGFEKGII